MENEKIAKVAEEKAKVYGGEREISKKSKEKGEILPGRKISCTSQRILLY